MSKIILFSHVLIFKDGNTLGLALRTYQIAKTLRKKGHDITIAEKGRKKTEENDGITYVPWSDETLSKIEEYDVAIAQIWGHDTEFLDKVSKIPLVSDIYAPAMLEHTYYSYDLKRKSERKKFQNDVLIPSFNPLMYADLFLCANENQKTFYQGMLSSLGRITPFSGENLIKIVPSGIRKEKPKYKKKVFRADERFKDKKIILWQGPFFPWFDPKAVIEAFKDIVDKHPDYVLVFVGGINPRIPRYLMNKTYRATKGLASRYGLLDKSIFFIDWMKHDDLENIFFESEFMINIHKDTIEAKLSQRGRTLEGLWARIPILTNGGDQLSEIIRENSLGHVIDDNKPETIKKAMERLIKDPEGLAQIRKKIDEFLDKNFLWEKNIGPLDEFCKNPKKDEGKTMFSIYSMLRDNRDERVKIEKIRHEEMLEFKRHLNSKEVTINEMRSHYTDLDQIKQNIIKERDNEISRLFGEISILKNKIDEKDEEIVSLNKDKARMKEIIGRFRHSIVYPFYVMTSTLGNTSIGKFLQKILK